MPTTKFKISSCHFLLKMPRSKVTRKVKARSKRAQRRKVKQRKRKN